MPGGARSEGRRSNRKKKKCGKIISHIYGVGGGERCGCGEEQLQFPHDRKQLHSFLNVILSGRKVELHLHSPAAHSDNPGDAAGR